MIQLHDSLSGRRQPLETLEPGHVRLYVCGVTVYDYCHLGHARVMIVFDMFVRYLRARGWRVTYVRNVTDIDRALREARRVLKPGGTAFLHHSNLGAYKGYYRFAAGIPKVLKELLQSRGVLDFDGWRALSVSAAEVASVASDIGLTVHSQELVPWGGKRLIDCFTVLGKGTSAENQVYENHGFVERAREIRRLAGGL